MRLCYLVHLVNMSILVGCSLMVMFFGALLRQGSAVACLAKSNIVPYAL